LWWVMISNILKQPSMGLRVGRRVKKDRLNACLENQTNLSISWP
jgi:hypothetical protein